jgi:predicted ATPase
MSIQTNLPLEQSSHLGRDTELSDLRRFVGEQRLVTLTGPGGTGKTRIAKKAARSLIESFEHGVGLSI